MNTFSVKELADSAGVNVETIRYYEREGVLPQPKRMANGYRRYTRHDVERLTFVQRAKGLGFTLKEVADLLGLYEDPDSSCSDVFAKAEEKLADIEAKIADLQRMRDTLLRLTGNCPADETNASNCRILAHLIGIEEEVKELGVV